MTKPRFDTLPEWLAWQETLHPTAIELKLERIRQVAERLGCQQTSAKVVTVAGTNGKGSCVAALVALLSRAGRRIGAYTSPHITQYNERIQIRGEFATDAQLCEAFAAIDEARGDISLTYFEFGTLAAFYLFQQADLDYWVLEVGLGGRLDATNVIDTDLAIVTSIALDHCEWLGESRAQIAQEKIGICRPGKPCIVTESNPPEGMIDGIEQKGALPYVIGKDMHWQKTQQLAKFTLANGLTVSAELAIPAPSALAALKALQLLGELDEQGKANSGDCLDKDTIEHTLSSCTVPGRWQSMTVEGRQIILEVGHNPAAGVYVAEKFNQTFPDSQATVVLAMMADKDIQGFADAIGSLAASVHVAGLPGFSRAATPMQLAATFVQQDVHQHADVENALVAALNDQSERPILVLGSFYTVAAATARIEEMTCTTSLNETNRSLA